MITNGEERARKWRLHHGQATQADIDANTDSTAQTSSSLSSSLLSITPADVHVTDASLRHHKKRRVLSSSRRLPGSQFIDMEATVEYDSEFDEDDDSGDEIVDDSNDELDDPSSDEFDSDGNSIENEYNHDSDEDTRRLEWMNYNDADHDGMDSSSNAYQMMM
jgi:hypothetical protein